MYNFDLIVTASCYYSPHHSIRLIKSLPIIEGKALAVITCPRNEDAQAIAAGIADTDANALILKSYRAERHLCQDLGFLYCHANGIKGRYLMFADDDIEFVKGDLFTRLDNCPNFSTWGFSSSTTHYGTNPFQGRPQKGDEAENPIWIDGHNLTVHWDDLFKYGLFDALPGKYNSSFVEVEIMHRYRVLSGNPAVGSKYLALHHHSRVDNVEQLRDSVNQQSVVHCGYQLWEKKYDLPLSAGDFNSSKMGWDDVFNKVSHINCREKMQRHMILDGIWLDYDKAWDLFSSGIKVIWNNQ